MNKAHKKSWIIGGMFALASLGLLFTLGACQGISKEEAAAKDRQIQELQTQLARSQKDTKLWTQLVGLFMPVDLRSMTDHRAYMLPTGVVLALHFDNLKLDQAENLNWVAIGMPGKFSKQDQERINKQFGPGFTHFHDLKADTHGGPPGTEGVWFMHVAVREFDAPWGRVKPGVDLKFMPTPAP